MTYYACITSSNKWKASDIHCSNLRIKYVVMPGTLVTAFHCHFAYNTVYYCGMVCLPKQHFSTKQDLEATKYTIKGK